MSERLWTFDAVQPGQSGPETQVTLSADDIAEYAAISHNDNPYFGQTGLAMPTMILSYAPLMRESIANTNGFVALEQSKTARRQTPFTKCEIRWYAPVAAGDCLTATRRVHEVYARRGSNFVTFRVQATNQRGVVVGEYDYTCIFDYARGQRSDRGTGSKVDGPAAPRVADGVSLNWAGFDSIGIGDELAGTVVSETQDSMNAKDAFRLIGERGVGSNIHTDEAFARDSIFGTTVNSGPATMTYVDQMLERSFGPQSFYQGGRLLMRAITPFRAKDTVVFSGAVTKTRTKAQSDWVDCMVQGHNQAGDLVCSAEASLCWLDRAD